MRALWPLQPFERVQLHLGKLTVEGDDLDIEQFQEWRATGATTPREYSARSP